VSHSATCHRAAHDDPRTPDPGHRHQDTRSHHEAPRHLDTPNHQDTPSHQDTLSPDPVAPVARRNRVVPRRRSWSFVEVREVRWSGLALAFFALALSCRAAGSPPVVPGVLLAGCYLAGGWEPGLAGLRALRSRTLDVDILMIVAALVAAGTGQAIDGALLIVIFATSAALEAVATRRTRDSVRSLLDLAPERAVRLEADGSETVVDTADLAVGDLVVVRPGERIGADGVVVDGTSDVEQASITGEPLPVATHPGVGVFAGTLNGTGMLRIEVERAAADTVVARVVALVEEASATKARTQLFIESIEQRYSVGVVAVTVALLTIPLVAGADLRSTLLRAMTFMIVASPCALLLATMPPLLSAIATAGRHGVLVKSAVVMELLGHTDLVAFDKTGTLTEGTPRLADVFVVPGAGLDVDGLLAVAAAAEVGSEHPLGRAIVAAARTRGLALPAALDFASVPGRGVCALIDGRRVEVGNPVSLTDLAADRSRAPDCLARMEAAGRTAVVVLFDGTPVGVLGLADQPRPDAARAVAALQDLTGRRPILLSGDNRGAAVHLAGEVGISDVRAGLLPHDKVSAVRELQADGTALAVVGDGVNDAPALAAAHLGLAMGRMGADLTLDTADAIIVGDDLTTIPAVIDLSRRARRVVVQNLCFAGTVVCALVAIDLFSHLPLPVGVAAHEGSTVIVGLNGLRLLSSRSWPTRPG
jgi:heavy metal translocating P-type ATPase